MKKLFYIQALLIVLIAILHIQFGLGERFFWTVWWWDVLLHVLGGLWVALAGAWALSLVGIRLSLWHCVALAFAVGVGWEIFEYLVGIGGSPFMSYQLDTAKDLSDDMLGGFLGGWSVLRLVRE